MEHEDCVRTAGRTVTEWELVDPIDCVLRGAQCRRLRTTKRTVPRWELADPDAKGEMRQDAAREEPGGASKRNKAVGRA